MKRQENHFQTLGPLRKMGQGNVGFIPYIHVSLTTVTLHYTKVRKCTHIEEVVDIVESCVSPGGGILPVQILQLESNKCLVCSSVVSFSREVKSFAEFSSVIEIFRSRGGLASIFV